jgi:hypothetical protein
MESGARFSSHSDPFLVLWLKEGNRSPTLGGSVKQPSPDKLEACWPSGVLLWSD